MSWSPGFRESERHAEVRVLPAASTNAAISDAERIPAACRGAMAVRISSRRSEVMKKVVSVLSLFLLAAGLMLAAGCNEGKTDKKPVDKQSNAADKGDDLVLVPVVLEVDEIDIIPGEEKQVKVKSGKADGADVPADSGLKATTADKVLTISAAKDAKEGTHKIAVKSGKVTPAILKVNVKPADETAKPKEETPKKP